MTTFQSSVAEWTKKCFGILANDKTERNHRFLEESLELIQSIGCTADDCHKLVDYVFGRDKGNPLQELGGVMVTLAALAEANAMDMNKCGEAELKRVWRNVNQIRAKHLAKPQLSPLPGVNPAHPTTALVRTPDSGQA